MSENDMARSQSEPGSREPSQQAVSAFGFDPSRVAAEPVAWAFEYADDHGSWYNSVKRTTPTATQFIYGLRNIRPLYEHPPATAEPVSKADVEKLPAGLIKFFRMFRQSLLGEENGMPCVCEFPGMIGKNSWFADESKRLLSELLTDRAAKTLSDAQGIEARQGRDEGSVHESPVAKGEAP